MNRTTFYAAIRNSVFGRQLTPQNVDGINAMLDYWDAHYRSNDLRCLAYCFATVFHETDGTMRFDIREYGRGKGKSYGIPDILTGKIYYGRGPVQITWKNNYQKLSEIVGLNLVNEPDLVLTNKKVAAASIFVGMFQGFYTGKKLADFFGPGKDDPYNARRIINGTDKAAMIAKYYRGFFEGLEASTRQVTVGIADVPPEDPEIEVKGKEEPANPIDEGKSLVESKTIWGGLTTAGGGVAALLSNFSGISINAWMFGIIALLIGAGLFLVYTGRIDLRYKTGV